MPGKEVFEEHKEVIHYTTQIGLEGILNSQALHATHFKYLNDSSELVAILPKFQAAIKPFALEFARDLAKRNAKFRREVLETGKLDEFVNEEVSTLVATYHNVTLGAGDRRKFFEPYIIAFSRHDDDYERANGLLSQWRAYGGAGGYALVFDTKGLVDIFKSDTDAHYYVSGLFGDVVYDGDDKKFEAEFEGAPDAIWRDFQQVILQQQGPTFETLSRFMGAACRFKHRAFREENEVRAILAPMSIQDISDFRRDHPKLYEDWGERHRKVPQFKSGMTPYLSISGGAGSKLPIKRIIVGPHIEKELRKARLDRFLELTGVSVPTSVSETPLV